MTAAPARGSKQGGATKVCVTLAFQYTPPPPPHPNLHAPPPLITPPTHCVARRPAGSVAALKTRSPPGACLFTSLPPAAAPPRGPFFFASWHGPHAVPAPAVLRALRCAGLNPLEDCSDSFAWFAFGTYAASIIGGLNVGVARNVTIHSGK